LSGDVGTDGKGRRGEKREGIYCLHVYLRIYTEVFQLGERGVWLGGGEENRD